MTSAARVFVSAGSNIAPRVYLEAGCASLRQRFGQLTMSPVYQSPAEGFDGPPFLNLVAAFTTDAGAETVLRVLAELEESAGRDRSRGKFSSRTLDLDLLLHGDTVNPAFKLPHPDIERYAFVLRPLADLAPNLRHPVTGAAMRRAWSSFPRPHRLETVAPLTLTASEPS